MRWHSGRRSSLSGYECHQRRIGHRLKLDPKVTADQRGHGVGVAINEYTKTSVADRATAAKKLEESVLGKVTRMPKRKAS